MVYVKYWVVRCRVGFSKMVFGLSMGIVVMFFKGEEICCFLFWFRNVVVFSLVENCIIISFCK